MQSSILERKIENRFLKFILFYSKTVSKSRNKSINFREFFTIASVRKKGLSVFQSGYLGQLAHAENKERFRLEIFSKICCLILARDKS